MIAPVTSMRTTLLMIAAAASGAFFLVLAVAVLHQVDTFLFTSPGRSAHFHADSWIVELIYTHHPNGEPPANLDRDWTVLQLRRTSFRLPFAGAELYTMYVITIPHLCLLPLTAVLPTIAALNLRRRWLRRLNESATAAATTAAVARAAVKPSDS
jgi:hypothetical protein